MISCFSTDTWLAEVLERPVFKLISTQVDQEVLSVEMSRLCQQRETFFYAKLPTTDANTCLSLSRAGFLVVDTGITLAWNRTDQAQPSNVNVSVLRPEQHQEVIGIASRCFRWSRFHLDSRIPNEFANRIKYKWVENYCHKRCSLCR